MKKYILKEVAGAMIQLYSLLKSCSSLQRHAFRAEHRVFAAKKKKGKLSLLWK